ncbi:uncharacterized protein [Chironomus tepperi]|uniref:uncharacterized protein n=1 Tax=Chironomus tepperi TaxID=113505 RepID=UPI00391F1F0F
MEVNQFFKVIFISLVILSILGIGTGFEDIQPASAPVVWGNVNQTRRIAQQRFHNYPPPGGSASGTGSMSTSHIIRGMRLTRLNNTDGSWALTSGGLDHTFVRFDFRGIAPGRGYDFNLELFGTGATKSISIVLVALSSVIMFIKSFVC